jgi:predicted Zn-dependent protease
LRAIAIGLTISFAAPVFADNLPEVQRLIKQGQYPQALEKVDAYLSNKPKDAQGRFLKGLIYTEMNKPAEAISVFHQAHRRLPGTARAVQQPGGSLCTAKTVRQGAYRTRNGHTDTSILRHRL